MNRSQSAGSASYSRNPSRLIQSANLPYYDANFMYGSSKQVPRSQKSFDGNSIQSYGAVQGSLRGSMVSSISNPRKSQKSIISNYPPIISKQFPKTNIKFPELQGQAPGKNNDQKKPANPQKNIQDKVIKKLKPNYYVDEDYFYSSQFKRNFVKGMLTLARNKNVEDLSLFLRQLAPTIMVKSDDTSLWVAAYLIVFRIQYRMRKSRPNQEELSELIQDELVEYMLKNRSIKKARLIKILVYIFKQLPIYKPKVLQWFEQFIKKNKDRLRSVDISRFIDINTLPGPTPIDYMPSLNKSMIVKTKQADKQREKQNKRQLQRQKQKQKAQYREQKQKLRKIQQKIKLLQNKNQSKPQNRLQKAPQSSKQRKQNKNSLQNKQIQKQRLKDSQSYQQNSTIRLSAVDKQDLKVMKQKSNRKIQDLSVKSSLKQDKYKIPPNSFQSLNSQPNLTHNLKPNTSEGTIQKNALPQQSKLSLQQMISRRIQNAFPNSQKNNQNKQSKRQGSQKQGQKRQERQERQYIQAQSIINQRLAQQKREQMEIKKLEAQNQHQNQQIQSKNEKLKQRIKLLAKNRQEELKSQPHPIHTQPPKQINANYQFPSGYNSFQPNSSYNQYQFLQNMNRNEQNLLRNRSAYAQKYLSYNDYQNQHENQNQNESLGSFVAVQNQNDDENYMEENLYENYNINDEENFNYANQSYNQAEFEEQGQNFEEQDYQNYRNL